MIPLDAALLSLLALKLLRKERLSHIDDFNEDEAVLENHYIPCRGQACPSVQAFFAQEHEKQVFCYANANLTRDQQVTETKRFADYWHDLTGRYPEWLYFDSKMTTYDELSELNSRKINFVTIRRRGTGIVKRLLEHPVSEWTSTSIDIPKRRQKKIRYFAEDIKLDDYTGTIRQIAVTGFGREKPTLFITNNQSVSPREIIMNYARRNGIEDGLGTNVNFFHMDNLSSEVRLNVDLDVTLTVIANSCYRWLATKLKGFESAKPKQISRKFVETSGEVTVMPNRTLLVTFDRRCHNPILQEAALDKNGTKIPRLNGYRIKFSFR